MKLSKIFCRDLRRITDVVRRYFLLYLGSKCFCAVTYNLRFSNGSQFHLFKVCSILTTYGLFICLLVLLCCYEKINETNNFSVSWRLMKGVYSYNLLLSLGRKVIYVEFSVSLSERSCFLILSFYLIYFSSFFSFCSMNPFYFTISLFSSLFS
jgi:hypothetical protein